MSDKEEEGRGGGGGGLGLLVEGELERKKEDGKK